MNNQEASAFEEQDNEELVGRLNLFGDNELFQ